MLKYIFIYRDKKLGIYGNPILTTEDKEHVIAGTSRGLSQIEDNAAIVKARDHALYYLGTFEDEDCKFDLLNEPEKLLDCEDYLCQKKKK